LPLFASGKADAKLWHETSSIIKTPMPPLLDPALAAALGALGRAIEGAERLNGASGARDQRAG